MDSKEFFKILESQKPGELETESMYVDRISNLTKLTKGAVQNRIQRVCKKNNAPQGINGLKSLLGVSIPIKTKPDKVNVNHYIEQDQVEWDENLSEGTGKITYKGMKQITSEVEAIEFFNIDTEKYQVKRLTHKSYSTPMKITTTKKHIKENGKEVFLKDEKPLQIVNYYCSVELEPKTKTTEERLEELLEKVSSYHSPYKVKKAKGSGIGVYFSGDYHLGLITDSYGTEVFIDRLEQKAAEINADKKAEVHLCIVGDLLEAGTLMHQTQSWELDFKLTGLEGARTIYRLMKKHLFDRVKNLSSIRLISGNHGRFQRDKKEADKNSSIALAVYYFLIDNMPEEITVEYDRAVLAFKADGVGYIATHGDLSMTKKHANLIMDYGFGKDVVFHVLVSGHLHSRKDTKATSRKMVTYQDRKIVVEDNQNFRVLQVTSFCDANQYAKDLGLSGTAGFLKVERAVSVTGEKFANVRIEDIPLA